jgi:flagellar protein FlaG
MQVQNIGSSGAAGDFSPAIATGKPNVEAVTTPPAAPVEMASKAVQPVAQVPSAEQLKQATALINKAIQSMSSDIQFTVDQDSHTVVVKVINTATNEVIRQIPNVETLAIAKALDSLQGLIIRQKA